MGFVVLGAKINNGGIILNRWIKGEGRIRTLLIGQAARRQNHSERKRQNKSVIRPTFSHSLNAFWRKKRNYQLIGPLLRNNPRVCVEQFQLWNAGPKPLTGFRWCSCGGGGDRRNSTVVFNVFSFWSILTWLNFLWFLTQIEIPCLTP